MRVSRILVVGRITQWHTRPLFVSPPKGLEATSELRLSVTLALYGVTKNGSRQSLSHTDVSDPSALMGDFIYANHKNCLFLTVWRLTQREHMKLFATPLDVVIKFISPPFANNFIIQTVEPSSSRWMFSAPCLHLPTSTQFLCASKKSKQLRKSPINNVDIGVDCVCSMLMCW